MFKGTPELIERRREEIVDACEKLYQTKSFWDITLKDISSITSFSRPTIYNYFQTKEEIFLALFKREYLRWNADLAAILENDSRLSKKDLADQIAKSLAKREQLLKLLSMNIYDMETNSRVEQMASFKKAYGQALALVSELFEKFCPDMSGADRHQAVYIFFPFLCGVYPYTQVTDKQAEAMAAAGVHFPSLSIYEIVDQCLVRLLEAK
jgi:AcrR family transcriptional regulator